MYWDGIVSEALKNSVIDSNTVEDNGQSGIYTGGNNVSSGNVITNNIVQHNRNEGIDQGVTGQVVPGSNSLSKLVIANNTSVDNFRRDIWINQADGVVAAWNVAKNTPNYFKFWNREPHPGEATPCMIWAIYNEVDDAVFTHNQCIQSDPAKPALVFNPKKGRGSVVGNNSIQGARQIGPDTDRDSNTVLPENTKPE